MVTKLPKYLFIILLNCGVVLLAYYVYTEYYTSADSSVLNSRKMSVPPVQLPKKIQSVEFEVFGRVQGVFFRKYTQKRGKELGLKGWCMNTSRGTVQGVMEGPPEKIEEMKKWLQATGSPLSKIEKAEFRNEKPIPTYEHKEFKIRR